MMIFVVVSFIDLEHRIIPDFFSIGGLALGIFTSWSVPELGWWNSIFGAALGFLLFYGIAWSYYRFRKVSGLGGGDIKFLATIGSFIGPNGVIVTVFISSLVGSIAGIGWALLSKKSKLMKLSIPFGPFLVLGALSYYFLGDLLWLQFMTAM
jgi:leader peptidase (prepilin peptidase)/N-methyltransferase